MKNMNEARRYLLNAKEILREKAVKEDGYYKDRKYVKMAGHTAYVGVLEALDVVFGNKKKGRKSIEWYQEELASVDKKMLNLFGIAYDTLHLAMSYDGNLSAAISKEGLEIAEKIIDWAEQKTAA
ncbi:MAG: DUF5618 family protein [Dyadobacter sp.]|uniref:DUF5618 family protein n=1 Tax=Dyadobacter sp. TaxID=1914288 RepID=UPI001B221CF5|nr:DUF5618 family protein [Dyadobacter sp.]MBO9612162.1 DUF5618 family protein [Dyadobacter sp.]